MCVAQASPRTDGVFQCVVAVAFSPGTGQLCRASICAPLCPLPAGSDTGQEPQPRWGNCDQYFIFCPVFWLFYLSSLIFCAYQNILWQLRQVFYLCFKYSVLFYVKWVILTVLTMWKKFSCHIHWDLLKAVPHWGVKMSSRWRCSMCFLCTERTACTRARVLYSLMYSEYRIKAWQHIFIFSCKIHIVL